MILEPVKTFLSPHTADPGGTERPSGTGTKAVAAAPVDLNRPTAPPS